MLCELPSILQNSLRGMLSDDSVLFCRTWAGWVALVVAVGGEIPFLVVRPTGVSGEASEFRATLLVR